MDIFLIQTVGYENPKHERVSRPFALGSFAFGVINTIQRRVLTEEVQVTREDALRAQKNTRLGLLHRPDLLLYVEIKRERSF